MQERADVCCNITSQNPGLLGKSDHFLQYCSPFNHAEMYIQKM